MCAAANVLKYKLQKCLFLAQYVILLKIDAANASVYGPSRSLKAGPRKEVMPMEQFLSDVAAHVAGGVLVAFILRRIFRR